VAVRPKPRSNRLLLVVFVSLALATITLDYKQGSSGPLAGLGRAGVQIMGPLQRTVTKVTTPIADFFIGLAHLPSLQADKDRLEKEVASLRAQVAAGTAKDSEIATLTDLIGLKNTLQDSDPVAGNVVGSGLSNFEWTIEVDVGSSEGVRVDDPVVAGPATEGGQALLVGHVINVTADFAVVQLIIDRDSFVGSRLAGSSATGLVQGEGEDDMSMSLVDTSTIVSSHDLVVTSGYKVAGQCGLYPPGIVVGEVSRTIPPTNDLEAFILVRPVADFSQLREVLVLRRTARACA
jgi:rod shape-determining protein MreC